MRFCRAYKFLGIILSVLSLGIQPQVIAAELTSVATEKGSSESAQRPPTAYDPAISKMTALPKNFKALAENLLKNGWKEDPEIIGLIEKNQEAIRLFKETAALKSDGNILGRPPVVFDVATPIPRFPVLLFQLVALDAKYSETKGDYANASQGMLSAVRFLGQLSKQKFPAMFAGRVQIKCWEWLSPYLKETLGNPGYPPSYSSALLQSLNALQVEQDYFERAFEEEKMGMRNTMKAALEESARGGGKGSELDLKVYKQSNPKLFAEMIQKKVDAEMDDYYEPLVEAAKENDPKIYADKYAEFKIQVAEWQGWRMIPTAFREMFIYKKSRAEITAEQVSRIFLVLTLPSPESLGYLNEYHNFLKDLANVIRQASLKAA